jgi:hypothetical protein
VWWLTSVILATWKTKTQRTEIQGQPGQKVSEMPRLGIVIPVYNPSYEGSLGRGILAQVYLGKQTKILSENKLKQKGPWAWLK